MLRFEGAETSVCFNAVDRWVEAGRGKKVAFLYEGNDGETAALTYAELLTQTCRLANVLKKHGVKEGDMVCQWVAVVGTDRIPGPGATAIAPKHGGCLAASTKRREEEEK